MINRADILLQEPPASLEEAYDLLTQRVEDVLARRTVNGAAGEHPEVVKVSISLGAVDPFLWLQAQDETVKMMWAGRGEGEVTAMCGAADVIKDVFHNNPMDTLVGHARRADASARRPYLPVDELFPLLKQEGVRYVGGFRFDADRPAGELWRPFGASRFILPRFELSSGDAGARLTCLLVFPKDGAHPEAVREALQRLQQPEQNVSTPLPQPLSRTDLPSREHWLPRVQQALNTFRETSLEKIVLARRAIFDFAEAPDPFLLLKTLRAATPDCFHFCFQPERGKAFIGASPERLFKMEDGRLETEAVAGTRPRGATADDDARLREELLTSEKDRREHAFVRDQLQETLQRLCEMVSLNGGTSEMQLTRGRHLYAGLKGILRPGVSPLDVLRSLHPTPAVGGTPTEEAKATIRRWESFDRGWYAGPIGWISRNSAEFAVAIRSGLLTERRLALYSGAGIVEGSQPLAEWEEIEHKICDFIDVLGRVE